MISIVVCHRDKILLEQFEDSVKKTIGVEYELQIIDNTNNIYTIFEAYNLGIERSKYEVVCFAHEDLIFHTENWGKRVIKHLEDTETGMIGVVGGNTFPNCPAPWWNNPELNDHLVNNIQVWKEPKTDHPYKKNIDDNPYRTLDYQNPTGANKVEAVALDGLWMCAHKRIFSSCKFDSDTFKGFHCYDTDFCFQVLQNFKIYVVYDVLLEHLSDGSVGSAWADSVELLTDKWKESLPMLTKNVSDDLIHRYNSKCLLTYCYWIQSMNYDDQHICMIIQKYLTKEVKLLSNKEHLLLALWRQYGYSISKIIFKLLKYFVKG